jgi:hypothetical protein
MEVLSEIGTSRHAERAEARGWRFELQEVFYKATDVVYFLLTAHRSTSGVSSLPVEAQRISLPYFVGLHYRRKIIVSYGNLPIVILSSEVGNR